MASDHHSRISYTLAALVVLVALQGILAIDYQIINEAKQYPGGIRFEKIIGVPYTRAIMKKITNFVRYNIFNQRSSNDQKPVPVVTLYIKEFDGAEAVTWGSTFINVSSIYLNGYQGNLKWEFTSLLHHEMTHVFQWNGEGQAPIGLIEGIADYTILKAKYYPEAFAKPGQGDKWDQGYDFTARFLEYCDGLMHGNFVAALNKKMRYSYSDQYFVDLLGKPVDQLWREYKAHYGHVV